MVLHSLIRIWRSIRNLPKGSCKYPNLQQLPSDDATRSCFVAPEGHLMVSADFSALESRLGADIYQEKGNVERILRRFWRYA